MNSTKGLEQRLRRRATRDGLRLEKSRKRDEQFGAGKFCLVDDRTNVAIFGIDSCGFNDATLDEIAEFLQTSETAA